MSKKILLADDSITIQKVIELTFSDEDFDVVTVGNGRLALEKLPEVRPDIVLCDIIMPEKDGYEVCEQVKSNPATAHIPVLLLTGAFEPFDQERAARAGYDGSLAKPFEPETLIAKVKDLLARAPVRAAAPAHAPSPRPVAPPAGPPPAPAVLPFQRPAPLPPTPPPAPPPATSFIPDEPFGHLEEPEPVGQGGPTLAPITEDESATLLAPPAHEPPPSDNTSTVMFRAADLPWTTPPAPPVAPTRAPAPAPAPPRGPTAAHPRPAAPGPEPVFVPVTEEPAEVVEEPAVFEEVLEEDLDFGETSLEDPAPDSGTVLFTPGVTLPGVGSSADAASTGAFEPEGGDGSEPHADAFSPVGEPVYEPEPAIEPEPVLEEVAGPEPGAVLHEVASAPEPDTLSDVEPAFEPEPAPAFVPEPPRVAAAVRAPAAPERVPAPESFADIGPADDAPHVPVSETANLSVPVEMVEKIAQRVVAQISEKAVREIAWEVVPDLAEALIKREIERLKAELAKS